MDTQVNQISPERGSIAINEIKALKSEGYILEVFDERVVSFFHELSVQIMREPALNRVPATAALGFWLRRSHIQNIVNQNNHLVHNEKVKTAPAGIVFHICPANVDTMFLYSMAISLLCGNKNILRISKRVTDPLMEKVYDLINALLADEKYQVLQEYICLVNYGHDEAINNFLSQKADVRIIWGGDNTIKTFKKFETRPRTRDIAFADRISCSLFKASAFLVQTEEIKREIARKFFNDSYTFDQLGCSSPQVLFVEGTLAEKQSFEEEFYAILSSVAENTYNNDIASMASLKLNKLVEDAIKVPETNGALRGNNYLYLVDMEDDGNELLHSCGAGYFYTRHIENIEALKDVITRKLQTISYFGLNESDIAQLVSIASGRGVDRIVPVGHALDFEFIWDGYNLFDQLTSKIWVI